MAVVDPLLCVVVPMVAAVASYSQFLFAHAQISFLFPTSLPVLLLLHFDQNTDPNPRHLDQWLISETIDRAFAFVLSFPRCLYQIDPLAL
eukprot:1130599_1